MIVSAGVLFLCCFLQNAFARPSLICANVDCPDKNCTGPYLPENPCCPSCRDCTKANCVDEICAGAYVKPGECCKTCPDCDNTVCVKYITCDYVYTPAGNCCEACPRCYFMQQELVNDQRIKVGCKEFQCEHGKVTESDQDCYKGCDYKNNYYNHGERFKDHCNECMCKNGTIHCTRRGCDDSSGLCPALDPADKVCPDNPAECELHTDCKRGELCCYSPSCQKMVCKESVFRGKDQFCHYNGVKYVNDKLFEDADGCNECFCVDGLVMCTLLNCGRCANVMCEPYNCTHPATNECCKTCEDCEIMGHTYRNGQNAPCQEQHKCHVCKCSKGNIIAVERPCPTLVCAPEDHVKEERQCCPKCKEPLAKVP